MRPKIVVFRSSRYIYGQIINEKGEVLVSVHEKSLKLPGNINKTERAVRVGEKLANLALKKKISKKVSFDRGNFRFHGRVKAFAEGARKAGLEF